MRQLSNGAQQKIIAEVLSGKTMSATAKKYNIAKSTVCKLVARYRANGIISSHQGDQALKELSAAERLEHLLATAAMSTEELGAYCRTHGLYSFQLQQWKKYFVLPKAQEQHALLLTEVKALRTENKKLKYDIKRKDAALSEASALLVLKKRLH